MLRPRIAVAASVAAVAAGAAAAFAVTGSTATGSTATGSTASGPVASGPTAARVGHVVTEPAAANASPGAPEQLLADRVYAGGPGPEIYGDPAGDPSSHCWTMLINEGAFWKRTHGCPGFPTVYVEQISFVDQNGNPIPAPWLTEEDMSHERDRLAREAVSITTGHGMQQ